MLCIREAGAGGEEIQEAIGQLTSSKGPERMGNLLHEKGIAFPYKLFLLASSKYAPAWFYVFQNEKEFSVHVKK